MTRHSCHTCHFSRDITSMSTLSQDIWSGQVLFKSGLTRTQQWLWQVTNMTNVKNMNDMTTARRPWPISILSFIFLRRSTLEAIQCQTSDTRHLSIRGKRGRYIVNSRCLPLLTPALSCQIKSQEKLILGIAATLNYSFQKKVKSVPPCYLYIESSLGLAYRVFNCWDIIEWRHPLRSWWQNHRVLCDHVSQTKPWH